MRLIDADAMIARCGHWYTEEGTEDGLICTVKQLLDAQPTVDGWISVNDRLPEPGKVCLVWFRSGGMNFAAYNIHGFISRHAHSEITHWMPLPKPPKRR